MHAEELVSLAVFSAHEKHHLRSILYESACDCLSSSNIIKCVFCIEAVFNIVNNAVESKFLMHDYYFC